MLYPRQYRGITYEATQYVEVWRPLSCGDVRGGFYRALQFLENVTEKQYFTCIYLYRMGANLQCWQFYENEKLKDAEFPLNVSAHVHFYQLNRPTRQRPKQLALWLCYYIFSGIYSAALFPLWSLPCRWRGRCLGRSSRDSWLMYLGGRRSCLRCMASCWQLAWGRRLQIPGDYIWRWRSWLEEL